MAPVLSFAFAAVMAVVVVIVYDDGKSFAQQDQSVQLMIVVWAIACLTMFATLPLLPERQDHRQGE